ncbi:MBOAT family O-acyltransferase [Thalassospiraceae bacterium LMO-JJ14]|nr:MBOAT family O-acyltransferase [Thalassospiraceae bacterium LMO-JJ14]
MAFHQPEFLVFLVAVVLSFRWAPARARAWILLGASIVVYAWAGWRDMAIVTTVLAVNIGLWLSPFARKVRITLATVFSLGALFSFKYATLVLGHPLFADNSLPLGISFYVFQLIAWQVDTPQARPGAVRFVPQIALFVKFFPQLVAGPIVRYHELMPQLKRLFQGALPRQRLVLVALGLVLVGLFKKRFLADPLAGFVDQVFQIGPQSLVDAWIGAGAFAFQIYFDFSGYSDMAVGMGLLFGLKLPRNFIAPYLTTNPTDFWRRWHITLSTWIRDYLYIPLGGAKRGVWLLVVVMAIAGLWHGANVTFIMWGVMWGVYCAVHRLTREHLRFPKALAWSGHMAIVLALWVIFRADSLEAAGSYLAVMAGLNAPLLSVEPWFNAGGAAAGLAALMALHWLERRTLVAADARPILLRLRTYERPWVQAALWGLIVFVYLMPQFTGLNPFIYFRF